MDRHHLLNKTSQMILMCTQVENHCSTRCRVICRPGVLMIHCKGLKAQHNGGRWLLCPPAIWPAVCVCVCVLQPQTEKEGPAYRNHWHTKRSMLFSQCLIKFFFFFLMLGKLLNECKLWKKEKYAKRSLSNVCMHVMVGERRQREKGRNCESLLRLSFSGNLCWPNIK